MCFLLTCHQRPSGTSSRIRRLSPVKLMEHQPSYTDVLGTRPAHNSTLSYMSNALDVPGTTSHRDLDTAVFGSSQLTGCAGDFCNFDISYIENKEILGVSSSGAFGPTGSELSDFRRRLLEDTSTGDDDEDVISIASNTRNSHSNHYGDHIQQGSVADNVQKGMFNKLPLRIIIQTRQEMPLVNKLLKRIRKGDDTKMQNLTAEQRKQLQLYVTEDNYSDLCISGKLPNHYYKDAHCCNTCFKVYKIITDARAEAIRRIEKKRDQSKKKSHSPGIDDVKSSPGIDLIRSPTASHDVPFHTPFEQDRQASLQVALKAIEGLTKLDVAEIRTMSKPPAAVEVVMEAVIALLTGKTISFQEARRLLGGGEAFLLMLREFQLDNVTDSRLRMIEPYVDNPVFRPENVLPVSYCASKFCGWVLGVVQAARWQRGFGHKRSDLLTYQNKAECGKTNKLSQNSPDISNENLSFVEKLERKKARRDQQRQHQPSTTNLKTGSIKKVRGGSKAKDAAGVSSTMFSEFGKKNPSPQISRSLDENSLTGMITKQRHITSPIQKGKSNRQSARRQQVALVASQKRSIDRLSSQIKSEGNLAAAGVAKWYRCYDGITKMPYTVLGTVSLDIRRCNFIIVHDFFDTHEATAIACKPLVQRHDGSQVFCFNYPGQANTVWPRPSAVERQRGAKEQVINNDWIADRMHELLQHAEQNGDILLTNPFHLVGIGNGASIASAFALRYGSDPLYAASLRSLVSVNGFLYPDPQLSAILHSASQVFETTPHSRPDIPISYWSRFVFSEEYLSRINPNLALNIYTAVTNPITNDGRSKITRGCLRHLDLRGSLNPDKVKIKKIVDDSKFIEGSDAVDMRPLRVPVIILQSTENMLVSAANVDPFLSGRSVQHLWSHQQNIVAESLVRIGNDPAAQWVGGLCHGSEDYAKYSILGKNGLRMLLNSLLDQRGAFVMWTRAGHALFQENKTPVLDLLDALANPSEEYYGITTNSVDKASYRDTIALRDTGHGDTVDGGSGTDNDGVFDKEELLTVSDDDVSNDMETADEKDNVDESGDDMVLFEVNTSRLEHSDPLCTSKSEIDATTDLNKSCGNYLERQSHTPEGDLSSHHEEVDQVKTGEVDLIEIPSPIEMTKETDNQQRRTSSPHGADFVVQSDPKNSMIAADNCANIDNVKQKSQIFEDTAEVDKNVECISNPSGQVSAFPVVLPKRLLSQPVPDLPDRRDHVGEYQSPIKNGEDLVHQSKQSLLDNLTQPEDLKSQLCENIAKLQQDNGAAKKQEFTEITSIQNRIEAEQEKRRLKFEAEDEVLLSKLDNEMGERAKERERADRQRRVELQKVEKLLQSQGIVPEYEGDQNPVSDLPDMRYTKPADLPATLTEKKDPLSSLDKMIADEEDARKKGIMSMEQYEAAKSKMVVAQMDRDQKTRHMESKEEEHFYDDCARLIQRVARGYLGRLKADKAARDRELNKVIAKGITIFQAIIRGFIGRKVAAEIKRNYLANLLRGDSIVTIQRIRRGYNARKRYRKLKRFVAARDIQRAFRGYIGRAAAGRERARLASLRKKERAASKIQSTWRMKIAREEFRSMRIHMLAAIEIQRIYRGYLGRKTVARRREWETATPGPERIELGLKMIEESKVAFERQQEEIDALHRAQERAEARVSHIHSELKDSEKELVILERELQEIDQIERDLQIMTHERDVLANDIKDAAGMPRTAIKGHETAVVGKEPELGEREDSEVVRRKKAEAYALELTIQIKRAEREKKRQELETEFASVFQEVEKKRKALERLESSLADMEATRERKDREFRRLQKNLMQLLLEQKQELDDLREKGIQLETATATTAAAATATALKAKEHEKKSTAMFSQTEELMKFQFMSMSLSYFSSLNMLNQLRDMNSDTTSAAVSSSADSASAAAAAAIAANLPSMKKLNLGADDFVSLNIQKKKAELAVRYSFVKSLNLLI